MKSLSRWSDSDRKYWCLSMAGPFCSPTHSYETNWEDTYSILKILNGWYLYFTYHGINLSSFDSIHTYDAPLYQGSLRRVVTILPYLACHAMLTVSIMPGPLTIPPNSPRFPFLTLQVGHIFHLYIDSRWQRQNDYNGLGLL